MTDLIRRHGSRAVHCTETDAAIKALQIAQGTLVIADRAIDAAIALLSGDAPTPPDPPPGDVVPVGPGADLLALVASSPAGTVFDIDPGYVGDVGDWTIDKACTLRSAGTLPDGRVGLDLEAPTLRNAAIVFGASGISCLGLRIEGKGSTVITCGERSLIDRCVVTGSADGGSQQRGIYANAPRIKISGCHIGGIWSDVDTQAVLCTRYTNRLHIVDCLLEASGENFMAGGDDGDAAEETPTDILIEDCTITKPSDWRDKPGCTCKNLFELKNARRVVLRNCFLSQSWADGQAGYAVVLSVRNQYGRAPWSTIEDVLIEGNTIEHCGAGVQILGRDNNNESQIMRRVTIRGNTITDLSTAWQEGSAWAGGLAFAISGGPDSLTLEENDTAIDPGPGKAAIAFDQIEYPVTGLVIRGCRMYEADYGITGQADAPIGVDQIAAHAPGYVWEGVTIVQGTSGRYIAYPAGTTLE